MAHLNFRSGQVALYFSSPEGQVRSGEAPKQGQVQVDLGRRQWVCGINPCGGAHTEPLCITKLAPHLSGFGVRIGTTNLPDLLFQALSVAAAFAEETLFAETGLSGGLPAHDSTLFDEA